MRGVGINLSEELKKTKTRKCSPKGGARNSKKGSNLLCEGIKMRYKLIEALAIG